MKTLISSRRAVQLLCVLLLFASAAAMGQGKFGVGFVLGEPTGVAWKYNMNSTNAFDGAIGFSPFDRYRAHVDYLWQTYPFNEQRLALHYGVGAAMGFGRTEYIAASNGRYFLRDDDLGFAVRGVIGLNYRVPESPVDLFFEVAPLIVLTPTGGTGADVGLGVRLYP